MKKVLNKLSMFFQFLLFAVLFMGISYYGFTYFLPDAWNGDLGYLQILKPFYLLFMGTLTTVLGLFVYHCDELGPRYYCRHILAAAV